MWLAIINALFGFLGGPVIKSAVDAYKARLDAGNTQERILADVAGKELLAEQREAELTAQLRIAQIGHWYEPEHIFGYIMAFYIGKVLIWDAALHLGSTDAVHGDVGSWAGMIMMFYFGKRGIENVARILKR